jgi:hypothetical protein
MPRGTARRSKTHYAVQLTVPRRGGWRAWGAVRADFERDLAGAADPAVVSAEIASELRRGADYVRVSVALTVVAINVADALTTAWDAFRGAARDDPGGWEVAAATAQVQPEPHLASRPVRETRVLLWLGAAVQGIVLGCLFHSFSISPSIARLGIRLLVVSRRKSRGCRASAGRHRKEPGTAWAWGIRRCGAACAATRTTGTPYSTSRRMIWATGRSAAG